MVYFSQCNKSFPHCKPLQTIKTETQLSLCSIITDSIQNFLAMKSNTQK